MLSQLASHNVLRSLRESLCTLQKGWCLMQGATQPLSHCTALCCQQLRLQLFLSLNVLQEVRTAPGRGRDRWGTGRAAAARRRE